MVREFELIYFLGKSDFLASSDIFRSFDRAIASLVSLPFWVFEIFLPGVFFPCFSGSLFLGRWSTGVLWFQLHGLKESR